MREKGVRGQELPPYSPLTVVVPGAAALWEDVVKEHGRKTLQEVLAFILDVLGPVPLPVVFDKANNSLQKLQTLRPPLQASGCCRLLPGDVRICMQAS